MNIKTVTAGLVLAAVATLPSLASAHTLLGKPVHASVSVNSTEERTLVNNVTNVSQVTVRLTSQVSKRLLLTAVGTESLVSRDGNTNVANTRYNALTGSLTAAYMMSPNLTGSIEGGNRINDQLVIPGASKTIPYITVGLSLNVF